jgi:hypothetical protein
MRVIELGLTTAARPKEWFETESWLDNVIFQKGKRSQLESYRLTKAGQCDLPVADVRAEYDARYVPGMNRMVPIVRFWVRL